MSFRLFGGIAGVLLVTFSFAEDPSVHSRESMLRERLDHMRRSVELLRQAEQPELASEVAGQAEVVAQQLRKLQSQRGEPGPVLGGAPSNHEVMERLNQLKAEVGSLREVIGELREQLDRQHLLDLQAKFGGVDLAGSWLMTLPAGFEHATEIVPRGEGLYQVDVRGNLRGLYRHHGNKLTVEVPGDERLTEFAWEFQSENLLLLRAAPSSSKVGADYRGATLRRNLAVGAEGETSSLGEASDANRETR